MLKFLGGDGEQAGRIRAHDWAGSPVGVPEQWNSALRTLVGLMLTANQPMFVVWGEQQTLFYNDQLRPILGDKHPGALGRPFLDVWSDVADDMRPIVDAAYAGSVTHMDDITLFTDRNGYQEETHFSFSFNPIRDDDGEVRGFFCPCIETTQAVLAARTIRENNVRNRQIVDSAIDFAIVATDLDGLVTTWNEGAHRILGWTEAEMLGETAERFFTPEDRAAGRIETEMRCALEAGRGNDERWHVRKDGERFWAAGEMTPLLDDARATVGFVKVLRDRTEKRLAEEALSRNREELAQAHAELKQLNASLEGEVSRQHAELDRLWASSPDLLLVIGFDGVFQRVNPAWTTMLGYAPEELVGHHVNEFVVIEDHAATDEAVDVAAGGDIARIVNRYRHKDGSTRWISWVGAQAGDATYATGRDITAEREAAEALRQTEDALRQAQKVEAVGQLTGGVAHDFNNLLTVIRGSVDLLRRSDLSDDRRTRYVDAIGDAADRAAKLTSQLLAFARRQSLTPETFDAADSISRLRPMLATLAGSKVSVAVEADDCPCVIHADRSQFDTAIVNMAVNARDAMHGEGKLTITVSKRDGMPMIRTHPAVAGEFVTVALRDTGSGIDPEQMDSIFQPFFTTKALGHGTGLGLSQVFGFAKQSGGEVVVESKLGEGSIFTLFLPRAQQDVRDQGEPSLADDDSVKHGGCVLVVEDNLEVGRFATAALAELGYTTVLARDGAQALAELATGAGRFDVVFTDVVMPGMSGVELGSEIGRLHPDLPVILTSGYSDVLARDTDHGFNLIQKPYAVDDLAEALRSSITKASKVV